MEEANWKMISEIIDVGKRIYDISNIREIHRLIVFVIRSIVHYSFMRELIKIFQIDEVRRSYLQKNLFPIKQVTRAYTIFTK